jgi:hypothetical protein
MQMHLTTICPDRAREALAALSQSHACASDLRIDPWEFALPLRHLESLGINKSDLRWLVLHGYVTFRDRARRIQPATNVLACGNPGFIITEAGERSAHAETARKMNVRIGVPRWDAKRRQLSFDGYVVKQFRLPAGNQEAVLAAFEDEGWPPSVDDPLPFLPRRQAKERLHVTIRHLNTHHANQLVRFRGNGTGEAVLWEAIGALALGRPPEELGLRRAA